MLPIIIVCGMGLPLSSTVINALFSLPNVNDDDDYSTMETNVDEENIQDILRIVTIPEAKWTITRYGTCYYQREYRTREAKVRFYFL
ncbi:hypothetical protein ES332_D09G070900v1 [Gossypium tomentosum]|uniref:Uncharacterized protein n=1 Tax=Gossypium tomentosum TaxID=34277 RepID=A0A5D2JFC4_GOSTO|nr:hypothetical protein ES332_D09G070900v1 [Gossypium tomentosum]